MSEHGYGAYASGCRCEDCLAAKAAHMRDKRRREAAYANGQPGRYVARAETHGYSAYTDLKCRCPVCVAAKAADDAARRRRSTS